MYHLHQLCDKHPDILTTDVWITIGFTYNTHEQKYCLIKVDDGVCLACTWKLNPKINAFCFKCKAPRPLDWTTGCRPLDLFIMESWNSMKHTFDPYIQWIEYSLLIDIQEMTSLRHGCTLLADWVEPITKKSTSVMLKKIVDGQNAPSFNFNQVNCFHQ